MISAKLRAIYKTLHTVASSWDSLHKVPKKLLLRGHYLLQGINVMEKQVQLHEHLITPCTVNLILLVYV